VLGITVLRFFSLSVRVRPLPQVCTGLHAPFVEVAGQPFAGVAFGKDVIKVNRVG